MIFNALIHHHFTEVEPRQLRGASVNPSYKLRMVQFPTLQNPLLDKVIGLGTVLESVINFILQEFSVCKRNVGTATRYLKLGAFQLFFSSLQSGGYLVV